MEAKRYKMDITDVVTYLVGEYVDIVDYYVKNNKFTIVYDEDGETARKYTVSTKKLEEMLGVQDLVWKYDKQYPDSLDRIVYTRAKEN